MRLQIPERLDAIAVVEPIPPVRLRDWALATVLALFAVAFIAFEDPLPLWARTLPAVLAVGFVPFRRRIPLIALTSVSLAVAASVALALRGSAEVVDVGSPAGLADVVLFYALCRWSTPLRIGIGFIASVASELVILQAADEVRPESWVELLPWFVVAAFALAMRYRARALASRLDQVRIEERNSLARELHDTVAHHVSAIAVQAQAGQYVVDSDPQAAGEALRAIETIANASIDEMRQMVGILRSENDHPRAVAPDTLDILSAENEQPTVHVGGDTQLDELPAGVGAALFRIAQESITNARRHSRDVTFIDIVVGRRDDRVEMTVDNDGTPTTRNSGAGYGHVGMQERVEALGGTFESSARPARGWRTTTTIPLSRVRR